MEYQEYDKVLEEHGIKPTANRLIIAKALDEASQPMSMKELEYSIWSLDKSSISRTLSLFREHHLVHVIEGGEGVMKYELCHSHHVGKNGDDNENIDDDENHMNGGYGETDEDEHVHFYCERCHRTLCLREIPLPRLSLPEEYELHGINLVLRGICPECRRNIK